MTREFYEYPLAIEPSFYMDGEYVYDMKGECRYWVSDGYWYDFPNPAEARFWEDDGHIYKFPTGTTPVWYVP